MNRKNLAIRALSVFLSVLMLVCMVPVTMSAAAGTSTQISPAAIGTAINEGLAFRDGGAGINVSRETNQNIDAYYHMTPKSGVKLDDNAGRRIIELSNNSTTKIENTPVILIRYRTNTAQTPAFAITTTNKTADVTGSRTWDFALNDLTKSGSWSNYVVDINDIAGNFSGGEGPNSTLISGQKDDNWNKLKALKLTGVLFRPFGSNTIPAAGEYFDIAYVAFFASKEEANAFTYKDTTAKFMKNETEVFQEIVVKSDAPKVTYPTTNPTAPEGKIFKGWSMAANASLPLCKTTEIFPVFAKAVTLTFKDGTTEVASYTFEEGTAFSQATDLAAKVAAYETANKKVFKGWNETYTGNISADTTITGNFVNAYTVTFKVNGTTYATKTVESGAGLVYPDTPTAENCTALGNDKFTMWDTPAGTAITRDNFVVNAVIDEYVALTFGTTVVDIKKGTAITAEQIPAAADRKGHTFLGWFAENATTALKAGDIMNADAVYTAKYEESEPEDINIIFMADVKGTKNAAAQAIVAAKTNDVLKTVLAGADVKDPVLAGFTFQGWDLANIEGVTLATEGLDDKIYNLLNEGATSITIYPTYKAISDYVPEVPTVAASVMYFDKDNGLTASIGGNYRFATESNDFYDATAFSVTTDGTGESLIDDVDFIDLQFSSVKLADYPIVKIAYSANGIGGTGATVDFNPLLSIGRLWGPRADCGGDGEDKIIEIELNESNFTGGNTSVDLSGEAQQDWANIKNSTIYGVRIKPIATADAGKYINIKWVALFSTQEVADAFTGSIVEITLDGEKTLVPGGIEYKLPTPAEIDGKEFDHYLVCGDGYDNVTKDIGDVITPVAGMTITPVYKNATKFTITYVLDGVAATNTVELDAGEAIDSRLYTGAATVALAQQGRSFEGWYISGTRILVEDGYVPQKNLILVAHSEAMEITVTYKDAKGTIVAVESHKVGTKFELAGAPAYERQFPGSIVKFCGWKDAKGVNYIGEIKATKNLVLTAEFAEFRQSGGAPLTVLMGILKMIDSDKAAGAAGSTTPATPATPSANAEAPVAVFDATELATSKGTGGIACEAAEEDGKSFIRFSAPEDVTMADGVRNYVYLDAEKAATFTAAEAPVVKIGYRTNSAYNKLDTNPMMKNGDGSSRLWGPAPTQKNDKNWNTIVIDLATANWTGGEGVEGDSAEARFNNVSANPYVGFCLKPFEANAQIIKKGSYYDIEYIAFFKTKADADAYVFGAEVAETPVDDAKDDDDAKADAPVVSEGAVAVYAPADLEVKGEGGYAAELKDGVWHLTTGEASAVGDQTRYAVKFANALPMSATQYIKIGYKAKTDSMNFSIYANGKRLWDNALKISADGKSNTVIYDIAANNFSGGEEHDAVLKGDAKEDWEVLKSETLTGLLLRPFGTIDSKFYFDIEYVAIFSTKEAAEAYNA